MSLLNIFLNFLNPTGMDKALVLLPLKSKWKKLMQVLALVVGLYVCLNVSVKTGQPFERGGGAQKVSDPRFSHFVAPPPPHY